MARIGTAQPRPRIVVFAPSTLVTVTVEDGGAAPEVHFHAGGQGFWVARMAVALGADVILATALGGESGKVLERLLAVDGLTVHAVRVAAENGVYVHDRRGGARSAIAHVPAPRLGRHELDELYGIVFADALESGVVCLCGPDNPGVLDAGVYSRLAEDLRRNDVVVLADLTGPALSAALTGGVDVLKLSDTELVDGSWAADHSVPALIEGLIRLHDLGARVAIGSRGPWPAIALVDNEILEISGPRVRAADPSGTGDAMLAAMAVSLAGGRPLIETLRFGSAAGIANAARHGLGSGARRQVEHLARHVAVDRVGSADDALATAGTALAARGPEGR